MEDRPPVNITSPGPVPINLNVCKMRITRDETGTFHIEPDHQESDSSKETSTAAPRRDREVLSMQLVMQQLKADNDMLKKKLAIQEKSTEALK